MSLRAWPGKSWENENKSGTQKRMRPVTIKRELFYAIQQGGRIDPKTGRLIKADDTKNVTDNVTETTSTLAQKTGVSRRTIARDMDVLKEKGFVTRIGPDMSCNTQTLSDSRTYSLSRCESRKVHSNTH